jgi:hypothetical protein
MFAHAAKEEPLFGTNVVKDLIQHFRTLQSAQLSVRGRHCAASVLITQEKTLPGLFNRWPKIFALNACCA